MKAFKQAQRYGAQVMARGSKMVAPLIGVGGSFLAMAGAHATGTDPISDALASIDLTSVAAGVSAAMLLVIGISLAFKGGDVGKRAVRKV